MDQGHFQTKKGYKNTHLKGMDEFLQAELEADPIEVAGHGEIPVIESHQKISQGVAKHSRPQSTKAGS